MKEKLEKAIKSLAGKSGENGLKADDALKYTQAALNAANALRVITEVEE